MRLYKNKSEQERSQTWAFVLIVIISSVNDTHLCLFFFLFQFRDVNVVSQRCGFGGEGRVKQPCFDFWREKSPQIFFPGDSF